MFPWQVQSAIRNLLALEVQAAFPPPRISVWLHMLVQGFHSCFQDLAASVERAACGQQTCGMLTGWPVALKFQPWYAHCRLPPSTRPSDKGTFLCGHRSSKHFQLSWASLHSTRSLPADTRHASPEICQRRDVTISEDSIIACMLQTFVKLCIRQQSLCLKVRSVWRSVLPEGHTSPCRESTARGLYCKHKSIYLTG